MNAIALDVTGARRRRHRRRRLRRALVALVVAVIVAVVAGGVWLVGFSRVLGVREVSVRGTSILSDDDVVAAAAVAPGTPLARVDPKQVAARVATLRPVASVDVSRVLPGTVTVTVTERRPAYVWQSAVGYRLVDAAGIPYADVAAPPANLLTATCDPVPDQRLLSDIATVIAALPPAVRTRAQGIHVSSVDHITVALSGGAVVNWGSADETVEKARVIAGLINVPASVYDVSSPSHPATRR